MRHGLPVVLLAALLAGCGSERPVSGTATLWVTRDRGTHVLISRRVPAGMTAIAALERVTKVTTGYGGRFVQSIDGLAGDLSGRRDWFYFVNGYEADRGAADYTLHPGDVEWWDYRSWSKELRVPVVVGAFPEPFLHGYDGKRRRNVVVSASRPGLVAPLARLLHARILRLGQALPRDANLLYFVFRAVGTRFEARLRRSEAGAGAPVSMRYLGTRSSLLRGVFRYRYEVP